MKKEKKYLDDITFKRSLRSNKPMDRLIDQILYTTKPELLRYTLFQRIRRQTQLRYQERKKQKIIRKLSKREEKQLWSF